MKPAVETVKLTVIRGRIESMSTLTITEFLEARIAEDEAEAKWVEAEGDHGSSPIQHPARVLAECSAKRAIIKQHEEWPVLVERQPSEIEQVAAWLNDFTYRMYREIAWLTTKEYIKRFGVEPPTAPMIATLAAVYKDHPDYDPEWAL